MKNGFRRSFLIMTVLILISSTSFANMKKGRVAAGGDKTFAFTTSFDGPCTVSLIYDTLSADLDTAIGVPDTGDLVCLGVSTEKNFDSCTAGLPAGGYAFVVSSFRGASPFRVVVTCGGQESISAAGQRNTGVEVREIEPNAKTRKILDQLKRVAAKKN